MMAYGQPLHCFDADMVKGNKIIVKDNNAGQPFVTLDGVEHTLGEHDLAICNAEEPMCIAGVFGGKGSGTYETTTSTQHGFVSQLVVTVFLLMQASVSSAVLIQTAQSTHLSRQLFSVSSWLAVR